MAAADQGAEAHRHGCDRAITRPMLTAYALRAPASGSRRCDIYGESRPVRTAAIGWASSRSTSTAVAHSWSAAILGTEYGIGVRNGCFCAHPYVAAASPAHAGAQAARRRETSCRGSVARRRAWFACSLGAYNTFDEIDALVEMLERIMRRRLSRGVLPATRDRRLSCGRRRPAREHRISMHLWEAPTSRSLPASR